VNQLTRSRTSRELLPQAEGPHPIGSTLSEMNGKAKPISPTPSSFFFLALVTHLSKHILLKLKQSRETTLTWDRALPRIRAFVRTPAGKQVQIIQRVNHDAGALLANSKMPIKEVPPWATACNLQWGSCSLLVPPHGIQVLAGFVKVKT
jgi:hypothetical protein